MNIGNLSRGFGLIKQFIDPTVSTTPIIQTPPQKPSFKYSPDDTPLSSAEEVGISSDMLREYATELFCDKSINIQNLILLRKGRIVLELGYGCWDSRIWKNTFSQCKSITSIAVGLLLEEGLVTLSTPLSEIFGKSVPPLMRMKFKEIKLSHLLTMSTRINFNEFECMTAENWVKAYLNSSTNGSPEKGFAYNSLNSYMLAATVKALSGKTLSEYLDQKLFSEMGITNYYWEKCPLGIEKGGWGLYILPRDMAKLGQLMIDGGVWKGKRLLSEKYVALATRKKIATSLGMGNYDYGYHIWTSRNCDCFLFNGMLGQNMLCYRDNGIVVVSNAGNADTFQQNAFFDITDKYFNRAFPESLKKDAGAKRRLERAVKELSAYHPRRNRHLYERLFRKKIIKNRSAEICGSYTLSSKEAASASILPLMMQVVQNNYTKGCLGYRFEIDGKGLCLVHMEKDCEIRLHIGFDTPFVEEIQPYGEKCLVATTGEFRYNEDDKSVLKLKIDFLEYPFSRMIKFIFSEKGLEVRYTETPGRALIDGIDASDFNLKLPEKISEFAREGVVNVLSKLAAPFELTLYGKKEDEEK